MGILYKKHTLSVEELNIISSNINKVEYDMLAMLFTIDKAKYETLYNDILAIRKEDNKLLKNFKASNMMIMNLKSLKNLRRH